MRILGLIVLAVVVQGAIPAKILSILPIGVKSHSILFDRLLKELATRGHEITYLTPIPASKPTKNIKELIIPDAKDVLMGNSSTSFIIQYSRYVPPWVMFTTMPFMTMYCSNLILESDPVQQLLASDEKFDLIFGEPYMNEAVLAGFSQKYNAPIVTLSTFMPNVWSNWAVGNPAPAAYIPDPFYPVAPPLNFLQRVYNTFVTTVAEVSQRAGVIANGFVLRKHFGADSACIFETLTNTSLLLVNHHPVLSLARPQTPNTIDVAGMHIYPPKPLPKDLETFMSSAKDGVILFSMGTNVKSADLPKETIQGILKALGRLKEKVIWKFEEELENTPSNVMISKWLPQSDILAHPNLKLFITHGGLLSTTEAVFRGIPIVGIPVMADQPINMEHTQNAGLGITLQLSELSEETLYNAATEVLTNPKYKAVAKEKSRLLRDTPMTALDTAVWWMEFVLRNNGAPHLRSPGRNLWWFQKYLVDVQLFFLSLAAAYLYVLKCLFKKALSRWCCTKKAAAQKGNKKTDKKKSKKQN